MSESKPSIDTSQFATCTLLNGAGDKILVSNLWQKQKVIFVFLRHFACIACRAHAAQVWKDRDKYERTGAKLIFIGNGQPHFISKFQEDLNLQKAIILTDPTLESFKAVGFKNGFFYVANPTSLVNAIHMARDGHKQTSYSKDAGTHWQLGGVIAISTEGKVLFHFISEALGDFPDAEKLEVIKSDEPAPVTN